MNSENLKKLIICMPVYNDWESVIVLLNRIEKVSKNISAKFDIILVDDGSTIRPPKKINMIKPQIGKIEIIQLRRNIGHQRAIAIGLSYIQAEKECQGVIVMDADGEDSPEDVHKLIEAFERAEGAKVIFAKRARRTENYIFKLFYRFYKIIHFVLIGRGIEVGNFSIIPRHLLDRLVGVAELWNHYAASVYRSHLPIDRVPINRGRRIAGQSRMNFVSLVVHGLSALSVYSDIIGVRLLISVSICVLFCISGIIVVFAIKYLTALAIPGWTTAAMGILLILFAQSIQFSLFFVLFTLFSRSTGNFLPIRDYKYFILRVSGMNINEKKF
jgi:glycosyltransferase involved in cell wall biosynthesis